MKTLQTFLKEATKLVESKGDQVADKFRQQYKNSKMSYKAGESVIDYDINLTRDVRLNLVISKESGDIAFTGISGSSLNKAFSKRYVISDRYYAIDFINRIVMLVVDENGNAPKAMEWYMYFDSQLKRDSKVKAI